MQICLCPQRIKNCLLQLSLLLKVDLPLIKKPFLIETLQNMNYYMSGTFVTKFSLFTISNKVFRTSNNKGTNIIDQADV